MILRPFQEDAVEAILNQWRHVDATMAVLPTGTGKTICFAEVIRRYGKRALVIAHRQELVDQAADKIHRVTGLRCEVEMGERKVTSPHFLPDVVVTSVQTQTAGGDGGGRMGKFDPADFEVVVLDECHHGVSDTWTRTIDYYKSSGDLKVVGVTATPDRSDKLALGKVFDTVAYEYHIEEAITDGWLVPIKQSMVTINGLDYSDIRTTAGDLNGADLAEVLEQEKNLYGMAATMMRVADGRRCLVFTASVAQAERLSEILNRYDRGSAAWICGKTDKGERREALASFANSDYRYMVNVGCLTEGFDDPGIELVVMGRPTKSRSLYAQCIGRGTRPLEGTVDGWNSAFVRRMQIASSGKPCLEVLDFVGNAGRHKLVSTCDILGGRYPDEIVKRARKRVEEGEATDVTEALEAELEAKRLEELEAEKKNRAIRARLKVGAKFKMTEVNPFDVFDRPIPVTMPGIADRQLSVKVMSFILKQTKIDPTSMTYSEGMSLHRELMRRMKRGLCSFRQAQILQKHGYDTEVSRKQASAIIDEIATKEGWGKHG